MQLIAVHQWQCHYGDTENTSMTMLEEAFCSYKAGARNGGGSPKSDLTDYISRRLCVRNLICARCKCLNELKLTIVNLFATMLIQEENMPSPSRLHYSSPFWGFRCQTVPSLRVLRAKALGYKKLPVTLSTWLSIWYQQSLCRPCRSTRSRTHKESTPKTSNLKPSLVSFSFLPSTSHGWPYEAGRKLLISGFRAQ